MHAIAYLQENGSNGDLGWLLYLILGFFLIMVIVGWLVSRRKGDQPEVRPVAPVHHEEHATPDDLVKLEGIGPKVSRILNEAGISTFAALADADPTHIQRILSAAGLQMMNPEGWIEQARLAASGDWAGLEKLQSELKGGRRK